jgi:hypothetical protein
MAGKEYSIVILSSSPPAPDVYTSASPRHAAPTRRVAMLPSSPVNLSPPLSPRQPTYGALASGSRAAAIPQTAVRGFATVGNLVRSEHFANLDKEHTEGVPEKSRKGSSEEIHRDEAIAKQPRKRATAAKKATAADGEKPPPKPRTRKPKPNADDPPSETASRTVRATKSPYFIDAATDATPEPQHAAAEVAPKLTKAGKPRKPRAKKEKAEGDAEPKPKKARAVKPKVAKATKAILEEESRMANATTTSNADGHGSIWDMPSGPPREKRTPSKERTLEPSVEELGLEQAVSRRRDWTLPRDTVAQTPLTESTDKENSRTNQDGTGHTFTHMVSNFTYESPTARPVGGTTIKPVPTNAGVTKRRRAEVSDCREIFPTDYKILTKQLLDLPEKHTNSRASSPDKGKAPKKKPRTITDLVTGQYAPKDPVPDSDAITSDFFGVRNNAAMAATDDMAADPPQKKAPRQRSKPKLDNDKVEPKSKPRARKSTAKTAAKPKKIAEKLLSPSSAALRLQQQDLLFGTSSQLALEDSPTMVRQLQYAIKESEQDADLLPDPSVRALRWPRLAKIQGARGLWDASNRDEGGGLLEDLEKIYIPEPDRTQDIPLLMSTAHEPPVQHSEFIDIDEIEPLSSSVPSKLPILHAISQPAPAQTSGTQQHNAAVETSFHDIDEFDLEPPPSNQNAELRDEFFDIDDFEPAAHVKPHGSPLKKSEKSRPSATVKASSRKGRSVPPAAASTSATPVKKTGLVSASQPTLAAQGEMSTIAPPSTPPQSAGRFIDIDEILDSEEDLFELLSPTPPRVRKLQDSTPLPIAYNHELTPGTPANQDMVQVFRVLTTQLEWANIRPAIFASITAHVRSIPPTTNPKAPSWHEKILMYDPVILEDFTTYLNGNTDLRTYRRATQKQIKAWNKELKMKGNAILGTEKDDEVLAVKKELETYMVRDWCQDMSVCCVHAKESRGRGTARKGFY